MFDENLIGSKGKRIIGIDCSEANIVITRLSQLGDNWEITSKCPTCNKLIHFNKNNVNKLVNCKCGQKIKIEIPENLL